MNKVVARYWSTALQCWKFMEFASIEDLEEYEVEHDYVFPEYKVHEGGLIRTVVQ